MPTQAQSIPPLKFTRFVESTTWGIRVVWRTPRDDGYHPESFEVSASEEGIRVEGHSPMLDLIATEQLTDILARASVAVELIREGNDAQMIRTCLDITENALEGSSCSR